MLPLKPPAATLPPTYRVEGRNDQAPSFAAPPNRSPNDSARRGAPLRLLLLATAGSDCETVGRRLLQTLLDGGAVSPVFGQLLRRVIAVPKFLEGQHVRRGAGR